MWTAIFWLGLAYWAWSDWRTQSVPAWAFLAWSGLMATVSWSGSTWWWSAGLALTLIALAWLTHGLGAADVALMTVLSLRFPFVAWLWLVLLACLTALAQAWWRPQATYPFLPHLAAASLLITLLT